ncbi:hypothetical protein [Rhodobacter ferrooxidans]|uniref:Uncharacterized protein n=1 Tax=Rhodobacter ferrooxidans TaxID=371731 RepID=C8S237_9RHOB|nr:hypothetical protein [Rhodobacter sp. SW2]EEW24909.1 hypothetical protein Rsw2DRAFT_2106 [Rhodobacter sp. SW2]
MNDADRVYRLVSAVDQARRAYRSLAQRPELPSDQELARSGDYKSLLQAGTQIRLWGSRDMFAQMQARLYADDPDLSARAARDLPHLWAGIIDWPIPARPERLH